MSSRRLRYAAAVAAVMLAAGVGVVLAGTGHSNASGLPKPVDAIKCETSEQVLFHVHSHLAVFVDGRPLEVPEGIGIVPPRSVAQTAQGPFVVNGACFYWLHTHARDGIIHIDGRPFAGDPRAIALGPHRVIQLDVGRRTPPRPFVFAAGL
jgi:hypothetical protein